MDVFYNAKGIGDVLIFPLKQGERYQTDYERFGDIVKIIDSNDKQVLGYNVFNASKYFQLEETGKILLTENLLNKLKEVFTVNDLNDTLDIDITPKFVVGYVTEKSQHENADKLSVCKVDIGNQTLQIVCGAPNIDANQKVVVAKVGAIMPSGMEIKPTELRGVESIGMICSQKELGMPNAPKEKGIYILDNSYQTGQAFDF
ncbi:DUF4479 domain-containing protein [Aquibacillus halophilus]|uniref:DUF4479 domain-containing protein n=1 Tax=Aquibacillus halophilus TaxID=930132 RepID=A0A6A8DGH1_9BACI|nr:DUF4479 family protein [Aquibacillus halophilus]MRH42821.1 DUF4479 domain-containing protein [Aquibacillus halophilus]